MLSRLGNLFGRRKPETSIEAIIPEDEDQALIVAKFNENAIETIDFAFRFMIEQMQTTFRWLLASLLVLNGGAIAALSSSQHFTSGQMRPAATAFAIGCVSAVLTGLISALSPTVLAGPLGEIRTQFLWNEVRGEISAESRRSVKGIVGRANLVLIVAILPGLISVGAFCWGMAKLLF